MNSARSARTTRNTLGAVATALSVLAGPSTGCLRISEGDLQDPGQRSAPTSADELLTRYVEALGGADALRGLGQRTVEARMTLMPDEGCEPNEEETCATETTLGSFLMTTSADGRFHRRLVFTDKDERGKSVSSVSIAGFDGMTEWEIPPGMPAVLEIDDRNPEATREDARLHWYLDWSARGVSPELRPPRRVTVKDASGASREIDLDGVSWTSGKVQLPPREYWFDRQTGLLREEISRDEEDPDAVRILAYDDYREVDGVKVPWTVVQTRKQADRVETIILHVQRVTHEAAAKDLYAVPKLERPTNPGDPWLIALAAAAAAAAEDPTDGAAALDLMRAAWQAAHFEEARDAAARVLARNPREPEALVTLARASMMLADDTAAKKAIDRLAALRMIKPEFIEALRAYLALRRLDYRTAGQHLARAGDDELSPKYLEFKGKPFADTWKGDGCTSRVTLVANEPDPVIEVTLDDETVRLVIDSTVGDVVLPERVARKLTIMSYARGRLGNTAIGFAAAEKLEIGDLSLANVPIDIYPDAALAEVFGGRKLEGVIGLTAFSRMAASFDLEGGTITLTRDTPACKKALDAVRQGSVTPLHVPDDHTVLVSARLNGSEGLFLFNTGMRGAGLAVTAGGAERAEAGPPIVHRAAIGAFVDIDHVEVGGVELGRVSTAWGWPDSQGEFRMDGMIGPAAFVGRRITLEVSRGKMWLSGASKPTPAASKPSKGASGEVKVPATTGAKSGAKPDASGR